MPFKSKKQQRWAYATNKSWAKEWSDKTDQKHLPVVATLNKALKKGGKK